MIQCVTFRGCHLPWVVFRGSDGFQECWLVRECSRGNKVVVIGFACKSCLFDKVVETQSRRVDRKGSEAWVLDLTGFFAIRTDWTWTCCRWHEVAPLSRSLSFSSSQGCSGSWKTESDLLAVVVATVHLTSVFSPGMCASALSCRTTSPRTFPVLVSLGSSAPLVRWRSGPCSWTTCSETCRYLQLVAHVAAHPDAVV